MILPNVEIDLSTTSNAADGLSSTYSSNVSGDNTIVHSGSLSLSSAFTGPIGGPKDFDIIIHLTTPFLYNPTLGNLLMDVRNFGGGTSAQFDVQSFIDEVSRARNNTGSVGDASGITDSLGLVTRFVTGDVNPAPEPATLALVGLGMAGLAWRRRKAI